MTKMNAFGLSVRDKTPTPWGGYHYHHTAPQRRVPCALGTMLCPRSADDIPPISAEAMHSVQEALVLLANLVGDRDFNLYLANGDLERSRKAAQAILLAGKGLLGILRVVPQPQPMAADAVEVP